MAAWPNGKALDYDIESSDSDGIKRFQVRTLAWSILFAFFGIVAGRRVVVQRLGVGIW